jgi:hypothetical protein
MHQLREVEPSYVDTAPKRYTFTATIAVPIDVAWKELSAPPESWSEWFPAVSKGGFEGPPPYGVGTKRWVRATATDFRETVVEYEEPRLFTYRVDQASRPIAKVLVERWTLEPDGDGTRISWTMAMEPRLLFRLLNPAPGLTMRPIFRRAMRNLERRLSASVH